MRIRLNAAVAMIIATISCFCADTAVAQSTRPTANPNLPTLYIVGDSTVRNGARGQVGWGDPIAELFDRTRINIENRARGGRSSRTFQTEGLWETVLSEMKPGDFVLIQFGHNDGAPLDDEKRARGSIRGTGEESKEIVNPITKRQEVVHTFGWYVRKYARDAKSKGATPIVLSYVPRCPRPGDPSIDADAPPTSYALWAKESAAAEDVPFVDLYGLVRKHYATMTPEQIKQTYFTEADYTHTNAAGAKRNAEAVVDAIRQRTDIALSAYLKSVESK